MRRGIGQLLSIVILVIIVLGASAIIYVNFSRLIVEQGRDLDVGIGFLELRSISSQSSTLNLFRIVVLNTGNIPVSRLVIKLGDTVLYDNSTVDLKPGQSIKLNIKLSGSYNPGEKYVVSVKYYSSAGDMGMKQGSVTVEP